MISGHTPSVRKYDKNNSSFCNNPLFEVICQTKVRLGKNKCVKRCEVLFVEATCQKERNLLNGKELMLPMTPSFDVSKKAKSFLKIKKLRLFG